MLCKIQYHCIIFADYVFIMSALFWHFDRVLKMELPMTSRRKEIFFVALCVVFSALFTIGCSDSLLHPAQDGARILVQLENSSLRSGDTPPPTEKWQGSARIENRDGSESHHQDISSAADEFSITFENVVIGSEIRIHLDVTSSGETAKRYRGSSSWKKIIDGVNVIVIVLKEVGVDAATPTITKQPEGKTESFAAGGTKDITKKLMVEASVSDGGTLTYQWYSNNTNSTEGGTPIEDANSDSYEASVPAGETKYFYCIVINTNNNVSGNKTASVTSNVASLASIEGSLESITATYKGEYLLVGESSTDFTVIENYSDGNNVEIPLTDGLYTVVVPANSIGNVPVTIKSKDGSMQTQVPVPIKYELDVDNLTLNGSTSVEQNGTLKLVANYSDTIYQIHESDGSPTTYIVKDYLNISWQDATNQPNSWEAMAETSNAGTGKTATVTLTPTDEWCVTTGGITASHTYTVTAITQTYSIGDEYRDDSGALKGYVFEVSDSYIKIVGTDENQEYSYCGSSNNVQDWSTLISINDGETMYSKMVEEGVTEIPKTVFYHASLKNQTDSGWYVPTKDELFRIFTMNDQYEKLPLSGAYWSSTIASITGGYTAYYVQGSGASPNDSGTGYVDEGNNAIAVKKITLN